MSQYALKRFPGKGLTWDEWHALLFGPLFALAPVLALVFGFQLIGVLMVFAVACVAIWARFSSRTTVLNEGWYFLCTFDATILVYLWWFA